MKSQPRISNTVSCEADFLGRTVQSILSFHTSVFHLTKRLKMKIPQEKCADRRSFWKFCKKTTSSRGCNPPLEIRKLQWQSPQTFGGARGGKSCCPPENSSPALSRLHLGLHRAVMVDMFLEISLQMTQGGIFFFFWQSYCDKSFNTNSNEEYSILCKYTWQRNAFFRH